MKAVTPKTLKAFETCSSVQDHAWPIWIRVIALRRNVGFDAAQAEIVRGRGKELMDHVRDVCAALLTKGQKQRTAPDERSKRNLRWAVNFSALIPAGACPGPPHMGPGRPRLMAGAIGDVPARYPGRRPRPRSSPTGPPARSLAPLDPAPPPAARRPAEWLPWACRTPRSWLRPGRRCRHRRRASRAALARRRRPCRS